MMKRFDPCAWLLAGVFLAAPAIQAEVDYQTEVAPLLRDYCAGCHNEADYEAAFSVETFASLMEGGESDDKTIVVPGKPDQSYLLQTILKTAKPVMPPKKEPQMSDEEIDVLVRWVSEGAKGPKPEEDHSILSTLTVPDMAPSGNAAEPITAMEYSPDGALVAIGRYGRVALQSTSDGKVVRTIPVEDGKVNAVHFSPDGKTLVTATGITGLRGVAILWDVATGKELSRIGGEVHRDILFDAEFSPDGTMLATAGYDRIIRLWDRKTGNYLREFPSHNGAVFDLAFSPDGKVLGSASADSTCKIWQVETGKRLDTLNQPQGEQFRIAFTPDGKFIVGAGADNRIRLWRFLSKEQPRINPVVHARFGHEDEIVDIALSADGRLLATTSADRALKLWSLPAVELVGVAEQQPDVVSALAFLEGRNLSVARLDGSHAEVMAKAISSSGEPDTSPFVVAGETPNASSDDMPKVVEEVEGGEAPLVALGVSAKGTIAEPGDTDEFQFAAEEGETWIFETKAARDKSKLDSKIAIFDGEGKPVERAVLQAMRDSWLTFRGKDSTTSGDFRVHNWREMELNEYLYVNGEVVKLWHYPRGPDSGFLVYPGFGARHSFFETTPLSHPLGQPCYIVQALPAGAEPNPNGLPVYRLYYENDDEATRALGKDSKLTFTAPETGTYRIRVEDVRGKGGKEFSYTLVARKPAPDFTVSVGGKDPKISPGSGREIMFTATRKDGFDGPIEIRVSGLPDGLTMPPVVTIEPRQYRAFTTIHANREFAGVPEEVADKIKLTATATIRGKKVEKALGNLGKLEKGPDAKVLVSIEPDEGSGVVGKDGVLEFVVSPGETITARVGAQRLGFKERIDFGKEDSGRNLPHGLYVDNIGLNGLMIPVGKDDQRFFITAAKWVPDTVREFHIRTTADGKQASTPVRIRVRSADKMASTPR